MTVGIRAIENEPIITYHNLNWIENYQIIINICDDHQINVDIP